MVACDHIFVKCSDPTLSAYIVLQYVSKVYIDAWASVFRFRDAVMPMLLGSALHYKHVAIGQFETPLRNIWADSPKRRTGTRPDVGHVAHFKVCRGSEGERGNDRLRPKESPSISVPSDLIVAIKIQP